MKKKHFLFLSLTALFFSACSIFKKAPKMPLEPLIKEVILEEDTFNFLPIVFDPSDTLPTVTIIAILEKEGCFGDCPEFIATFYSNGKIEYEGIAYVENIGKYTANIDKETVKAIILRAERIDYFRLSDYYPIYGTTIDEVPATITTIDLIYKSNTITNKHHSPVKLQRFERYLNDLLEYQDWTVE